jgi:hypothetical protein
MPDPLSTWTDGGTKAAVVDIVERETTKRGAEYVPPERVAVFDND